MQWDSEDRTRRTRLNAAFGTTVPKVPHHHVGSISDRTVFEFDRELASTIEEAWAELTAFLRGTLAGEWDRDRVVWEFDSDVSPTYDFSKNVRLA